MDQGINLQKTEDPSSPTSSPRQADGGGQMTGGGKAEYLTFVEYLNIKIIIKLC